MVSQSADANTAPHGLWARMLEKMGARKVLVYHDYVPKNPRSPDPALKRKMAEGPLLAIASHGGHPLERIEVEAEAVGKEITSGISLVISGPRAKLEGRLARVRLAPNVRYAGFLEKEVYETLKATADFALNITDEPYTLSHVLFEFAASSLPVVSSRQPVVEEIFGEAFLYCDSTVEAVRTRIKILFSESERALWVAKVKEKHEELTAMHEDEVTALRWLVSGSA